MNPNRINLVARFVNRKKTTDTKVSYDALFYLKPHMSK